MTHPENIVHVNQGLLFQAAGLDNPYWTYLMDNVPSDRAMSALRSGTYEDENLRYTPVGYAMLWDGKQHHQLTAHWEVVDDNWHIHTQWSGINDYITIYRRRGAS